MFNPISLHFTTSTLATLPKQAYFHAEQYYNPNAIMRKLLLFLTLFIIGISTQAQDWSSWSPGCYYDLQNNKICGQIKWSVPQRSPFKGVGDDIKYRPTAADKRQKIETSKFRAFVIGADSFVVSHNKDLKLFPILKVVIDKPVKLYVRLRENHTSGGSFNGVFMMGYTSLNKTWYFGDTPDTVTEFDRKNFMDVMSTMLSDRPDLVKKIKNKYYRKGDIDDVMDLYLAPIEKARKSKMAADTTAAKQ